MVRYLVQILCEKLETNSSFVYLLSSFIYLFIIDAYSSSLSLLGWKNTIWTFPRGTSSVSQYLYNNRSKHRKLVVMFTNQSGWFIGVEKKRLVLEVLSSIFNALVFSSKIFLVPFPAGDRRKSVEKQIRVKLGW